MNKTKRVAQAKHKKAKEKLKEKLKVQAKASR
jgi:hypothetical protein